MNKCIVFSTSTSQRLAYNIAINAGQELGSIYHHQFPSGEWYCQLKENVRGADVFLIQPLVSPVNDNLMQLLIMADACRRASAGRIIAITPYLGYSRQDRKDKSRVPISAKLVMDILEASGINRIVTMDLHAAQIQGFTNLPFDHLYFRPVLINALKGERIDVVVSPDIGAIKRADDLARHMGKELAFISKRRISDSEVKAQQFVGDVKGKNVLIVDDLTESAGTLIEAATVCKKEGANKVFCAVTHLCINNIGHERITKARHDGLIDMFLASNSTNYPEPSNGSVKIVDIAPLLGDAIRKINTNESVSQLFE
jgi:ribose-phosphate pyrophosphokinase